HAVIVVVGRDQKHVVPDFVLRDFVLHGFPGEHQPDAGVILQIQPMMIAVMNLKLQIRVSRNAQSVSWRPRLRHVTRQVDRRHYVQIARRLAGNPAAIRCGTAVVYDWGVRRSEEHTSELQSLAYLVCRLLLEKKKKK